MTPLNRVLRDPLRRARRLGSAGVSYDLWLELGDVRWATLRTQSSIEIALEQDYDADIPSLS